MSSAYQHLLNAHLKDLNPIKAGRADMVRGPVTYKAARTCTMLHYVISGCGVLTMGEKEYPVRQGQAFLLTPKDGRAQFHVTADEPVKYRWVSFTGTMSHCFSKLPPVFDVPENLLGSLKTLGYEPPCPYSLASDLFMLRSHMIPSDCQPCDYVEYVMDYVQNTYMEPITVSTIAETMALDRSYLSRMFKKKTGQTLQNYIHEVRIQESKRLMMDGYSVKEAAMMCGFNDSFVFSKLFTQLNAMAPSEWKKIVSLNILTKKNHFSSE